MLGDASIPNKNRHGRRPIWNRFDKADIFM